MAKTPEIIAYDKKVDPFWKADKNSNWDHRKKFPPLSGKIHNGGKAA